MKNLILSVSLLIASISLSAQTPALVDDITTGSNPSSDRINIEGDDLRFVCVYNGCGILQATYATGKSKMNSLNISDLASGIYIVSCVLNDGSRQFGKFIKN